jgi:hypothetical protein
MKIISDEGKLRELNSFLEGRELGFELRASCLLSILPLEPCLQHFLLFWR